jgi:hypothetical protein
MNLVVQIENLNVTGFEKGQMLTNLATHNSITIHGSTFTTRVKLRNKLRSQSYLLPFESIFSRMPRCFLISDLAYFQRRGED